MPAPGKLWRHVIINTRCTWLHGDSRGFRSRGHEIHSSGDYKNPPPKGEHATLHRWMKKRARSEVHFPLALRPIIGRAIRDYLTARGHRTLCVAVAKVHAHALVELPQALARIRILIGQAKRKASLAVNKQLPGSVWAAGGTYKPVRNPAHAKSAVEYIVFDQGLDAWTWSYRDESPEGRFNRRRAQPRRRS